MKYLLRTMIQEVLVSVTSESTRTRKGETGASSAPF